MRDAGHSNGVLRVGRDFEGLADRVLSWPGLLRHGLVDDGDIRRFSSSPSVNARPAIILIFMV
jgi:hypothetical protein